MNLDALLDACPMRPGVHWHVHYLCDLDVAVVVEVGRGLGFAVTALAEQRDDWRDTVGRLCNAILASTAPGSTTIAPTAPGGITIATVTPTVELNLTSPPIAPAEPREGV